MPRAAPLLAFLLVLLLVAFAAPLAAKHLYQWKDAQGITHFSDSRPGEGEAVDLKATLIRAEQQQFVELIETDAGDGVRLYTFTNRLGGPVELELSFQQAENVVSDPPLPLRTVLLPLRENPVARIRVAAPGAARYSLAYRVTPGDPNASIDLDARYALPFDSGTPYQIHQGFNGSASHDTEQARYAVDFSVDEGTPVLAARGGVVMEVANDFQGAGLDREKFGARANLVRVLHDDGSMAVYAHLLLESVVVSVGQRVRTGQHLADSGNTGFSTGPHLHFAVQANVGMKLVSFPFSIEGVRIPGS
jgi:murein DD-endopeptidase MepM/ murein hydrolase activator NlpD